MDRCDKDKNYNTEVEYVYKKLQMHSKNLQEIIELGCGTGIHADLLQKKGVKVTGVELSASMAKVASNRGINCFIGDCSSFNFNKKFDAAISLFHVISYINDNEKLIKTFQNIYNNLKTGGVFLFDVWYTPAVYNLKPEIRIKRKENEEILLTRLAEPIIHFNKNVVDVKYKIIIENKINGKFEKIKEKHSMRHFSIMEIKLFALIAGFKFIIAEEWLTGYDPSENTWGVCFILKK